MGQLAMGVNPIDKFEGENAATPKERMLAVDDATGDLYVFRKIDGVWRKISRTAQIQAQLDRLEASGVFSSAAAFVNNRKIYRFYFDTDNGVVRLDPDLVFDSLYRYYAIRSVAKNDDGSYNYITGVNGVTSEDGDVTPSLVDMNLSDSYSSDGTTVSIPQVGGLVGTVVDGNSYMVEFYDSSKNLVNIQAYQAIKVRTASTDLCPDTAITDMYITCNQQNPDGSIFLYQGQDISELEIQTVVKYADGRRRDVSNEEIYGGRLTIGGLDEIDTSTITGANGTPQEIEVVYQMIRSNTSFSSNSSYNTENGATISPSAFTIRLPVKVHIVQDTYTNLETLIPVGYIEWDDSLATPDYRVKMKYFGHYSSGLVIDITNIVSGVELSTIDWGSTQTVTALVPFGNANQYKTFQFSISVPSYPASGSSYSLRIRTYGEYSRFITFDSTQTAGGAYSGKFTALSVATESGTNPVQFTDILNIDKAKYNDIIPTHVRVRSVKDPSYLYTDIVEASSNGIYYKVTEGHELEADTPLLLEFFNITTDSNGNAVSTFVTGAIAHYALPASS